jgi:MFS family permease
MSRSPSHEDGPQDEENQNGDASPLPKRQLAVLAMIALAEQTALNSISPYLPQMASSFPDTPAAQVGLYVGAIGSSFALAQFTTNYFWGWLSDRIGRKPVVLFGLMATAVSFCLFGFCKTLWQAILVQALMGLMNGNQGVISTCLGEITDKSNQSRAFVYLPVIYGIGGITGPALGGLLVFENNPFRKGERNPYPYLWPNLLSAAILALAFIATSFWLEESLEGAKDLPPLHKRVKGLFSWVWQFASGARKPTFARRRHSPRQTDGAYSDADDDSSSETQSLLSMPEVFAANSRELTSKDILNRDVLLLLATYLVFQLSNISFNSLYPTFAFSPAPMGRDIKSSSIGVSLSLAGVVTIIFQVFIFGKLIERMGNKTTYRVGLGMFAAGMFLTPLVGYKTDPPLFGLWSGHVWMWLELGAILLLKTIASVAGLTSALLLITNSANSDGTLGALNGLAQTLSAAGRAIGPVASGGLFSAAHNMDGKHGALLPFGLFGGIATVGFVASFWIKGERLESEGFEEEEEGGNSGEGSEEDSD